MKGGVENSCCEGNSKQVVSHGPGKVLVHDTQCCSGQADGVGNGGGLSAQEQHVAGFLCQVSAGTHGDACIGLGQGSGVIDSVSNHCDAQAALLQFANAG